MPDLEDLTYKERFKKNVIDNTKRKKRKRRLNCDI